MHLAYIVKQFIKLLCREQECLKQRLILKDIHCWSRHHALAGSCDCVDVEPLQYVGGVDLSFVKGDDVNACAALVVVKLPELEVTVQTRVHCNKLLDMI